MSGKLKPDPRWLNVLPHRVAEAQIAWERRRLVWRVYKAGVPSREIMARLGTSMSRVHQMLNMVRRELALRHRSPVEVWMASTSDIAVLLGVDEKAPRRSLDPDLRGPSTKKVPPWQRRPPTWDLTPRDLFPFLAALRTGYLHEILDQLGHEYGPRDAGIVVRALWRRLEWLYEDIGVHVRSYEVEPDEERARHFARLIDTPLWRSIMAGMAADCAERPHMAAAAARVDARLIAIRDRAMMLLETAAPRGQ